MPEVVENTSPGAKRLEALRFGGRSDDEITSYKARVTQTLADGGRTTEQIRQYWGDGPIDQAPIKAYVDQQLTDHKAANTSEDGKPKKFVSEIDSFSDAYNAILAGGQASVTGLIARQENPEVAIGENPSLATTILAGASQLVGDIPAMFAGGFLGGVAGAPLGGMAGSVVPGLGTLAGIPLGAVAGSGAGAFAAPAGMRKLLMDYYEKGEIKDPEELLSMLSSASWEAIKHGSIGLLTGGAGAVATKMGANTFGKLATELGTMTGASSAISGHLPTANEFAANALLLGGFHGVMQVGGNLRTMYAETGTRPTEIVQKIGTDTVLLQETIKNPRRTPMVETDTIKIKGKDSAGEDISFEITAPKRIPTKEEVILRNKEIPRSEDEIKILSQFGESNLEGPNIPWRDRVERFRNDIHPINEFVREIEANGGPLAPQENFASMAKLYRQWPGKLDVALKDGTFKFNENLSKPFELTGEGFYSVLDSIPKVEIKGKMVSDSAGATAYATAKRVLSLEERGIEHGFDVDAAAKVVKQGKGKFEEFHQKFQSFTERQIVDYAKDAGILSKESAKSILDVSKEYFPLHTVQEFDPFRPQKQGGILKRQTGSIDKRLDPIETTYKNVAAVLRAVERNRIGVSMVEAFEKYPEASAPFIRKLERDIVPTEVQVKELRKHLEKNKVPGADKLTDKQLEGMTIFRAKDVVVEDGILRVMRNGKPEYYEINKDLAQAMNALDVVPFFQNTMWKILTEPTRVLRLAVTKDPAFAQGTNLVRDAGTALVTEGIVPFSKTKETLGQIINRDPEHIQMLLQGGASTSVQENMGFLKNDVWKLYEETGVNASVWNKVSSPLQTLEMLGTALENSTRQAAFNKRGQNITGAVAARDVSVDFSIGTQFTRSWNQIDAFFNPSIQGAMRTVEAFGSKNIKRTMIFGLAGITTPTVINWFRNKDDSRVTNAPAWEKASFWHVPTDKWEKAYSIEDAMNRPSDLRKEVNGTWFVNNGTVFRFPKPPAFGQIFGSNVESLLDAAYDEYRQNPNGRNLYTDLNENFEQALSLNILPDLVRPLIEQLTNHVFFTGQPIIPKNLEGVAPELQYKDYTTETSKQLGKLIRAVPLLRDIGKENKRPLSSPLVIENYIRSWGGGLGKLATNLIDKILIESGVSTDVKVKPESTLADIPFIRAFVSRQPSGQSLAITDFNKRANEIEVQINTAKKMNKDAQKMISVNPDNREVVVRAEKMMAEAETLYRKYEKQYNITRGITEIKNDHNVLIQKIMLDDSMSKTDKRQLIDGLYWKMIEVSRYGNLELNRIEKEGQE